VAPHHGGPRQPGPGAHTPEARTTTLPRTGSNGTGELVAAGLTLVALGAASVFLARRLRGVAG